MVIHIKMIIYCNVHNFDRLFESNLNIINSDCLLVILLKYVGSFPSFDITYT